MRAPTVLIVKYVREAKTHIRLRIAGIEFDRLDKEFYGLLKRFTVLGLPEQEFPAAQNVVVRRDIACSAVGDPRLFSGAKGYFERADNSAGNVVLNREQVRRVAVDPPRPKVPAASGVDQLRGNPDAIARSPHRAFKHRADAEIAADGANIDRASLVGEARIARYHHQAGD